MRAAILCLLGCFGCTTVNSYAVLTPQGELENTGSCFRQCQAVRPGGTNTYLNCVHTCPGTAVTDGRDCESLSAVPTYYQCMTEHNKSFSVGKTILLIGAIVFVVALIGASSQFSGPAS